jgi:pantoate--beta-alanine ligase
MRIIQNQQELRQQIKTIQRQGNRTGLVPTMGYLHDGHLSLIRESQASCDITMVSIFVNPLQFNDPEDLKKYPRDTERDLNMLERAGVDLVFLPTAEEMYPCGNPLLKIQMPELTSQLCGKYRPGHFEGVLFIVLKLFQLFSPDRAFFGKKDYQQLAIIRRMALELSIPTEIVGCPLIREADGLAMSSRNVRLSEKGRKHATMIYRALKIVKKAYEEGKRDPGELKEIAWDVIETGSLNRVEYIEFVDRTTLQPVNTVDEDTVVAVAVYTEGVRLIDNLEMGDKE